MKVKIKVKCTKCGTVYEVLIDNRLADLSKELLKVKCPRCLTFGTSDSLVIAIKPVKKGKG